MGLLGLLVAIVLRQEGKQADPHDARALEDALRNKRKPLDPNFEQLVGRKCRGCKEPIAIQKQATRCPSCEKPIHVRCLDAHVATCGVPKTPYR